MAPPNLCGVWQIYKCDNLKGDCSCKKTYGIEGTTFQLDEAGDVVWKPTDGAKSNPILNCDTYEVYHPSHSCTIIQFGAHIGHVIEFKIEEMDPIGSMTLKNELWCCLYCKRIPSEELEPQFDVPYSLLPALENGFFSDTTIAASNGKQFLVHSSILTLTMPEIDWRQPSTPFSGLPEDVVATVLHYLYAECLPSNLTENCARQVISCVSKVPSQSLLKLSDMCELYIKHIALKKEIVDLTEDMHACANQIIEYFMGCKSAVVQGSDNLKGNPAKLCYVLKQCIRECAVGIGKFVVLCHIITIRNDELSAQEGREIIQYAKSRLPIFLKQLHQLMKAIKTTFSGMTSMQRFDIATYVVPEIEKVLEIVSTLAVDVKSAMELIINESTPDQASGREDLPHCSTCKPAGTTGCMANDGLLSSQATTRIIHILTTKEMSKLRRFHQWVTYSLAWLMQKRESFNEMSSVNKVRSVARNLDQIMEELPVFLLRLQDVDDKLEWREFKFIFKIAASKVAGWVDVIIKHKSVFQDVCEQVSNIVQREEFTKSVVTLGLINPSQQECASQYSEKCSSSSGQATSSFEKTEDKLNLLQTVCTSPSPHQSFLAKQALPLLLSERGCDMIFEVIAAKDVDTSGDHQVETGSDDGTDQEQEVQIMKAHRVIVAARCDWFRRALLSGMRETIDRKIQVYDTNPALFSIFLEYLYSGCINVKDLTVDQWSEILMLSDRYEVDTLKQICEQALKGHLDNDSVLYFLSLADQFNAKALKETCLTYASHHPEIMDHALFAELSQTLQAEIYDVIIWVKPTSFTTSRDASSSTIHSSDLDDLQSLMSSLHVGPCQATHSISDSLEELPLTQDASRLERCIQDLFDIVGEGASRHELAQIAMAADYDINRAVNFYYEQKKEA
ncbi:hypothetical protein ONE63_005346 [Megalurothrips usitatus]|uniref:BTB domain-containing protein n=1 Tax=Megalurothrips usitatus TaxID=439358 RepID=A0AAV7XZ20_9NEOP|nr:hypothetical protein ONE63_005346 [Megalurothrips usitatus]